MTDLGLNILLSENIFDVDKNSEYFLFNEIQDEKYELRFGDGIIGKNLERIMMGIILM